MHDRIGGDLSAARDITDDLSAYLPPPWVIWVIAGACALVIAIAAVRALRAAWRARPANRPKPSMADILTVVAASIATGVSAQGMWRFSGDVLGLDGPLRLLLFAFIEVAIITSAVRARRNMRENFSAGIDGVAVWALTVLTAVLSSMDARSLAEAVFRLAAPLVAAWLWERGMAIERHRIRGTSRINWRLTPERILVRLKLAETSDRTAGEVDTQRRLTRLALAAKRARELRDSGAPERKRRAALARLDRSFEQAAEHTGLGRDAAMQERVRAEVAALYSAGGLMDVPADSAWVQPVEEPFARLADETERLNAILSARHDSKSTLANLAMLAADATGHRLIPSTPSSTFGAVDGKVNGAVNGKVDVTIREPLGLKPEIASASTTSSTPAMTVEQVDTWVDFDINDPAVFELERLWSPTPLSTDSSIPPSTPQDVDELVDEDSDEATKTKVMRDFWDREVAQKRYPRPIDLANHATASRSLAARLRAEWVEELDGWAKRRAKKALREKASA